MSGYRKVPHLLESEKCLSRLQWRKVEICLYPPTDQEGEMCAHASRDINRYNIWIFVNGT